ncbi:hypothetical protein CLM62_02955 [Streptomyces sp. SA15]|uniref:hypothetical protein n=1 Tax=Streptomyces sp. SA15 TaxID=934019 RepID=UPI000BAF43BD|nr:hypothetical protein [Streptomyces sp. SA15]PAZ17351.1 hypothetical protein CLM62_02955 [Streptomyces sp. SA15]
MLVRLEDLARQVEAETAALRDAVARSTRPDMIDWMQAALAPKDTQATAYRQAERLDRFLTGDAASTDT